MSRPKVIVREPSLTDSDNVGTEESSWAPGSNTAGNSREPAGKASDSWGPVETALDSLGPSGNSWEPVKTAANSRGHGGTTGDSWGSAGTVGNSCGSSGAVDNEENLQKKEKDSTVVVSHIYNMWKGTT